MNFIKNKSQIVFNWLFYLIFRNTYLNEGLGSSLVIFPIPCYRIDLTAACISFERANFDYFVGVWPDFCE